MQGTIVKIKLIPRRPTSKPRARRASEALAFCPCGRRLTCWLCLGTGEIEGAPLLWIGAGTCYGCTGTGVTPCLGCEGRTA